MKAYLLMLKTQALMVLQYRAQAYAGVFTQFAFGWMRVFMMVAFYKSATGVMPLDLSQSVTYIWFTQMMITMVSYGPDPLVTAMVQDGSVAYEMIRPVRLSIAWWMRSLAFRGMMPLMRGIPILIFSLLLPEPYRLQLAPFTLAVPIVLLLAWLLAGAFNNFFNILTVYLMSADGIIRLMPILFFFFGGLILPMPLFPDSLQPFLQATPFIGIMDTPARVLMGSLVGLPLVKALIVQAFWILTFLIVNDWLLESRLKRAVVQGG